MNKTGTVLTGADVRKISGLANLPLSAKEISVFRTQLLETLNYIRVLKAIDTDNISPTSHVGGLINRFRDDVIAPSLSGQEALQNAQTTHNMMFKIKAVMNE